MTDLDRLREEYDEYKRHASCGHSYATLPGFTKRADALIAALGDEIAELTGQNIDLEVWRASAVKRAEQAEAEAARLRCCGNCEHFSSSLYACELWPGHDKDAPESCHFTPSRWKEAER